MLDYDFCRSIAATCKSRGEFARKDGPAYYKSLHKGWLDIFATEFKYMTLADANRHTRWLNGNYMTDEEVEAVARKYTTIASFRHRAPNVYLIASGPRRLIRKFTWLKRCPKSALPKNGDIVYVYEFNETHAAYVGRSCNLARRDEEHRRKDNDSLFIYSYQSGIPIPRPKILHTGITIERGARLEQEEIERYRADGWIMINRCRGGSIGQLGIGISKKKVIKTAKQYTTLLEFKHDHPEMVSLIYRMGWENEFSWLNKKEYTQWTRELCETEARKYTLHKDFRKKSPLAYRAALANGWLNDYTWLIRRISWNDFNAVAEESKKFPTRNAFEEGNSSAYGGARRNGWLDILYPPKTSVPSGHWDIYENVANEAKKFNSRSQWTKTSHGSYVGAQRNGWLDKLMPPKYKKAHKKAA
jgi:hypothetical protein